MAEPRTTQYVGDAIDELVSFLGVKPRTSHTTFTRLLRKGMVRECARAIAQQLGLPIDVKLSFVPQGFVPGNTERFRTRDLTRRNTSGSAIEGIAAQVEIPAGLPLFGSSALNNYPITIRITEGCHKEPFTFIAITVHEMSHVLLHALRHPAMDSEIHTDLTPLLLGFAEMIKRGRSSVKSTHHGATVTETTTTYGYLSDADFSFAYRTVRSILASRRRRVSGVGTHIRELERRSASARRTLDKVEGGR